VNTPFKSIRCELEAKILLCASCLLLFVGTFPLFVLAIFTGNLGIIFKNFSNFHIQLKQTTVGYHRQRPQQRGVSALTTADNDFICSFAHSANILLQLNIAHIWPKMSTKMMDRRIEMYLSAMIVHMTEIQYMSLSLPQCVECAIASRLAELRKEYRFSS